MKKTIFLFLFLSNLLCFFNTSVSADDFEKLFPILTKENNEEELSPKTTDELEKLFENSDKELPRVFVKKLPKDFAEKGTKKLYSKIITALILRENEQILGERILFLLLKDKFEKGIPWTEQEKVYFDYLVEKYDATVLKTTATKINDLFVKIDEIPPSLAIAQTALDTDFGKKNMDIPFGQTGWLDNKTYAPIHFKSLTEAVKSYVKEMNSMPNYNDWRQERLNQEYQQRARPSYYLGLRTYRPEDVEYIFKVKDLMNGNIFIFEMDKLNLEKK